VARSTGGDVMKNRPKLGSWHTITQKAIRVVEGKKAHWEPEPINVTDHRYGKQFVAPTPITSYHAMYIGYRFKQNGEVDSYRSTGYYADELPDDIPYFSIDETVEVWMFITHENRNPIPVFPFEFESEETE
jgi:hypothetical protein